MSSTNDPKEKSQATDHNHNHNHEPDHVHGPGCNHGHQTPFVRSNAKVGRNDPCICGSGAKYKKCCGKS